VYDLSPAELRVLGSLLEKQRTTPDTYPLTLNGLRAACNQSTNRDPVVQYDEETIRDALHQLGKRRWTRLASGHGSRAAKYRHLLEEELRVGRDEQALLAVLMLRGPQTPGELLQRTERLYHFGTADELHGVLDRLIERDLVVKLSRRPGQREERYAHLLSGEAPEEEDEAAVYPAPPAPPAPPADDRIERIERELADLRAQVHELRAMLTGSGQ
jgi:uncharacterized protein YceH (UPF0502 family)